MSMKRGLGGKSRDGKSFIQKIPGFCTKVLWYELTQLLLMNSHRVSEFVKDTILDYKGHTVSEKRKSLAPLGHPCLSYHSYRVVSKGVSLEHSGPSTHAPLTPSLALIKKERKTKTSLLLPCLPIHLARPLPLHPLHLPPCLLPMRQLFQRPAFTVDIARLGRQISCGGCANDHDDKEGDEEGADGVGGGCCV